jgi:hypothetical protein
MAFYCCKTPFSPSAQTKLKVRLISVKVFLQLFTLCVHSMWGKRPSSIVIHFASFSWPEKMISYRTLASDEAFPICEPTWTGQDSVWPVRSRGRVVMKVPFFIPFNCIHPEYEKGDRGRRFPQPNTKTFRSPTEWNTSAGWLRNSQTTPCISETMRLLECIAISLASGGFQSDNLCFKGIQSWF